MVEPDLLGGAPPAYPQPRNPRIAVGAGAPEGVTTIGKGVVIEGEVSGGEDIDIDGVVDGKIELPQHVVTVGPRGRVNAQVLAKSVVVFGEATGTVTAVEKVSIGATGSVEGGSRLRAWRLPKVRISRGVSTCSAGIDALGVETGGWGSPCRRARW